MRSLSVWSMTTIEAPRFVASRANMHHLHAIAALESLRVALVGLGGAIEAERYGWPAASDGVRSWAPSNGPSAKGGHGDPVSIAVTATVRDRCARRAQWTRETLTWLAGRLGLATDAPLDALAVALPRLRPATARELTRWLRELDESCREAAGLGDGLHHVAGAACPACDMRLVWRGPSGLATCRNTICVCIGEPCRCSLPGRVDGLEHVWRMDS